MEVAPKEEPTTILTPLPSIQPRALPGLDGRQRRDAVPLRTLAGSPVSFDGERLAILFRSTVRAGQAA